METTTTIKSGTMLNQPHDQQDVATITTDYEQVILELQVMVDACRDEGVNLAEFFLRLQALGFALISMVLAMPFLQPLPLGPFGTVAGVSLLALGWQMYRGRKTPVLPQKLLNANVRGRVFSWPLAFSIKVLKFCRKFCRPRMQHLVTGEAGRKRCGLLIATGGLLMCAPFIAVPFNNMLPAAIAFFAALGELERDGALIWVARGFLVATILFFAAIITVLLILGVEALQIFI